MADNRIRKMRARTLRWTLAVLVLPLCVWGAFPAGEGRAQEVDPDDMIRDSILASAHGFVYRIAKPHQTNAPKELADYKITGRFINF